MNNTIKSFVLNNRMMLITLENYFSPRVSIQLFYNVGSKNEDDSNRGIAHMIEHMIFKGTPNLPEGAIDKIAFKLSGGCNAFTSYDYTGYSFDLPSHNYSHIFPIIADCMENCLFDQNYLNSELKAVFQELKMYNDDYLSCIREYTMKSIFHDYVYKHPIIGYKNNIVNFNTNQLMEFYKKHYIPENAVMVVVGDIDSNECFNYLKNNFEKIKNSENLDYKYKLKRNFHEKDTVINNINIYREIEIPHVLISWEILGANSNKHFMYEIFAIFFANGRGSKLYKRLVYEEELATDVSAFNNDLFDYDFFSIYFQPKEYKNVELIEKIIFEELEKVKNNIIENVDIERAIKKTKMSYLSLYEDNEKLSYIIGKLYLATNNENALTESIHENLEEIKLFFVDLISNYLNKISYTKCLLSPMNKEDESSFKKIQEEKDKNDEIMLAEVIRENREEEKKNNFDFNIKLNSPKLIIMPEFQKNELSNGITLYTVESNFIDKIEICVDLKVKHYYDPKELMGRVGMMFDLMEEGTLKYKGNTFGEKIESYGIDFNTSPGSIIISCLPNDIDTALNFLYEYLLNPEFSNEAFDRIKKKQLIDIANFWDDHIAFSRQLIRERVYGKHPYSKNPSGTIDSINNLKLENIKEAFKEYCIPNEMVVIICGKINANNVYNTFKKTFSSWNGIKIESPLKNLPSNIIKNSFDYKINRDQNVILYGGLSLSRKDERYDSLLIYDQIFSGGVVGSMNSKLFSLRESTGFFYSIGGSLLAGCAEHNGMILIRGITSKNLVEKSFNMIDELINNDLMNFNENDIIDSKKVLINALPEALSNYRSIASSIIFMHRYDLNKNFFQDRIESINAINKNSIENVLNKIVSIDKLIKYNVGR